MDTKHQGLTAAERSYLEHAERAQGQGQTLAEYCRQTGLSPHVLYSARRGAKSSARTYTPWSAARVNGLEPHAYLRYLLEELPKAGTAAALEALLPWNVKPLLQAQRNSAS